MKKALLPAPLFGEKDYSKMDMDTCSWTNRRNADPNAGGSAARAAFREDLFFRLNADSDASLRFSHKNESSPEDRVLRKDQTSKWCFRSKLTVAQGAQQVQLGRLQGIHLILVTRAI
jgi:hypothetical protein